nr:fasciclin domain-containing protein [Allomuricauda sp.]
MKTIPHLGKLLILFALTFFIYSCSSDDNGGSQDDDEISITDDDPNSSDDDDPGSSDDDPGSSDDDDPGSSDDDDPGSSDDDDPNNPNSLPNIVEIVVDSDDLSLLEEAVLKAQLDDDLSGEGPFTVFAPTNAAIEELFDLLGDTFSSFDDFDSAFELLILEQILQYHVVPGDFASTDLSPGTLNTLLPNETLDVISSGSTFVIGDASDVDAQLIDVDNLGSNGVVHIIDKILIPQEIQDFLDTVNPDDPSSGLPTIKDLVESTPDLDFLQEALELTGLLDTLGEDGPFTVFAPTSNSINFFFGLLGSSFDGIEDFDLAFEVDLLRQVLSYHVVPGLVTSNDLSVGTVSTLLPNDGFDVVLGGDGFFLQDGLEQNVDLVITDIPAANGVIHTIDRILIPETVIETIVSETEQTLLDIIDNLDECDQFVQAFLMVKHLIGDLVVDHEQFTFFLPTNQAFLELFAQLDGIDSLADFDTPEELELLGIILSYHLVKGTKANSSDLFNGQQLATLQGEKLNIQRGQEVYILDKTGNPSKVTSPDIHVLNGVIHIIDKVLIPNEVMH